MAELQSCYFCGAVDDQLGEYGVVPESLLSDDEEQLTVVLCPTCHQKVTRVIHPVAERVADVAPVRGTDQEPSDDVENDAERDDAGTEPSTDNGIVDLADRGEDRPDEVAEADAVGDESGEEASADVDDDPGAAGEDGRTRRPRSEQPDVVFGVGDASDESVTDEASDASTPAAGDEADQATEPEGADDDAAERESSDPEGGETPDGYYQVLMLLQNREFPVNRADIEEVAVNAYELSHEECRRALDHAVDRGVVREQGGQLSLPDE